MSGLEKWPGDAARAFIRHIGKQIDDADYENELECELRYF
jgi:hypothetical protein